jgi:hypothetical protein
VVAAAFGCHWASRMERSILDGLKRLSSQILVSRGG